MTRGGGSYARGTKALAICERCAKKIPYRELRMDGQYPDLKVCDDCWDPKHPQEYLPDVFDPITLWDATGDPEKNDAGGYVTITSPWQFGPNVEMVFGIGAGGAVPGYALTVSGGAGDSFDEGSIDVVAFFTDSFDL